MVMKYITYIPTGFSVEINEKTGTFSGCLNASPFLKRSITFSGTIGQQTQDKQFRLWIIIDNAFPDKRRKQYREAMKALVPEGPYW